MNPYEITLIAAVAFAASLLTFFSGFGLGTLLTPVFLFFFEPTVAVALTAVVHFLNNLFKFGLMRSQLRWDVLNRFGWTALIGSFAGALLLARMGGLEPWPWIGGREIEPIKPLIGILLIAFSAIELLPSMRSLQLGRAQLPAGGLISGFFGGLSGHQGALRSMFLVRAGLDPAAYVATGTAIALIVDLTRIPVYWNRFGQGVFEGRAPVLIAAVAAALGGALLGKKWLGKLKSKTLHLTVGFLMMAIGFGLFLGWL